MNSILLMLKLNGKKRLSHVYTEEKRQKLILFMFERILRILRGFTIYVATPDHISQGEYEIVRDEWGDINKVIEKARGMIKDDFLILPCDLPFVEREDIDVLLEGKIKIVPSQDGGTNAFFLPVTVDLKTQFGENSFKKHLELLKCRNLEYEIYESERLWDIDSEKDLMWALEYGRDSEFSEFVREELLF
jgi:2-phospho-L-lactate guanylyltransferase